MEKPEVGSTLTVCNYTCCPDCVKFFLRKMFLFHCRTGNLASARPLR